MLARLSAYHEMCRPPTYRKYQCKPAASALVSLPRMVMFSGDKVELSSSKCPPFVVESPEGASSNSMKGDTLGARRSRSARTGSVAGRSALAVAAETTANAGAKSRRICWVGKGLFCTVQYSWLLRWVFGVAASQGGSQRIIAKRYVLRAKAL